MVGSQQCGSGNTGEIRVTHTGLFLIVIIYIITGNFRGNDTEESLLKIVNDEYFLFDFEHLERPVLRLNF